MTYIKAKYNNLIRPYMRTVKQGFGSLYGGNQTSVITPAEANIEGQELIVNGSFNTDSNWAKGTGWTIENGVASSDGVSSNSNLSTASAFYSGSVQVKMNISITNYVSGVLRVYLTGDFLAEITANGEYTFNTTADRPDGKLYLKSVNFIGSIDNVSVKEITTRTNERTIEFINDSENMFLGSRLFSFTNINTGTQLIFVNQSVFILSQSNLTLNEIDTERALEFINESNWAPVTDLDTKDLLLALLKERADYFENETATRALLQELQNCETNE